MTWETVAILVLLAGLVIGLPIAVVKGILHMREMTDRSGGTFTAGLAASLVELERITSPSVEHVEQVEESSRMLQRDDEGDSDFPSRSSRGASPTLANETDRPAHDTNPESQRDSGL